MPVVTLSGDPGSGKSTLRALLAKELGYAEFYAGALIREMAQRKNMLVEEFYKSLANDPQEEMELDKLQMEIIRAQKDIIVEGRIAPFLAPEVKKFRLYLAVSPMEGARRQRMRKENAAFSIEEIRIRTEERIATERVRYQSLYGIPDHLDKTKFDCVIETDGKLPKDTLQETVTRLREFERKIQSPRQ